MKEYEITQNDYKKIYIHQQQQNQRLKSSYSIAFQHMKYIRLGMCSVYLYINSLQLVLCVFLLFFFIRSVIYSAQHKNVSSDFGMFFSFAETIFSTHTRCGALWEVSLFKQLDRRRHGFSFHPGYIQFFFLLLLWIVSNF